MWQLQSGGWGGVRPRAPAPQRRPLLRIWLQIQKACAVQVRNSTIRWNFIVYPRLENPIQVTRVFFNAVTETALAVGIASLGRPEQSARKPSALPVKAHHPAQVSPLQEELEHCIERCQRTKPYWWTDIAAFCMLGNSSHCPPPSNAEDNTICVDNGRCHNGECNPFCEATQNLRSCACNGKIRKVWRLDCRRFKLTMWALCRDGGLL